MADSNSSDSVKETLLAVDELLIDAESFAWVAVDLGGETDQAPRWPSLVLSHMQRLRDAFDAHSTAVYQAAERAK